MEEAIKNNDIEKVKLLLADPRVDWRVVFNSPIIQEIMANQKNLLKTELANKYLIIERSSPQITFDDKTKSAIPEKYIKNTVYWSEYFELCDNTNKIPSIKLVVLAQLLNVPFDININKNELCNKVKKLLY